jgi:DNA-binding CsgD family transcriptional regulator
MNSQLELSRVRLDLDHAMSLARQDRWVLGSLREGRLRVLADSSPERDRPFRRVRPLSQLARRCLHDRRPLTVSAVSTTPDLDAQEGPSRPSAVEPTYPETADWELDWPALLYAPVGLPGRRPVGLLTVGCLTDHWYLQDEIDYLAGVGISLTSTVLSLDGPLARLAADERAAARLLGQGLSAPELAAALEVDRAEARELVGSVLRKLSLRSPRELAGLWPELTPVSP